MSAGDTERTGCENVRVRNTCDWPVADAVAPRASPGIANHPLGLLPWHRSSPGYHDASMHDRNCKSFLTAIAEQESPVRQGCATAICQTAGGLPVWHTSKH